MVSRWEDARVAAPNENPGPDTVAGVADLRRQGFAPIEEYTGAIWVAQLWPQVDRRWVAEVRPVWLSDSDSDGRLWLVRSPWPGLGLRDCLNVVWSWVERDRAPLGMELLRRRASEVLAWEETTAVDWRHRTKS
jgi:hypothetical protein